ncbi:MAG TPA: TIGR04255 family protein [Blastocatellia bacterium]|nr:TIGR04255 family protein [Blastocatellia bacterium]
MPFHFPRKPEIRLEQPPLIEVVCQVKFPAILRIAKEGPSEFQEIVRERFPQIEVEQNVQLQIPGIGGEEGPAVNAPARVYRFRSPDTEKAISLGIDFFALSTTRYIHWDDFAGDLKFAYDSVQRVYNLLYLTRIGLRYINRLTLSNTGSHTVDEMLGFLVSELRALLSTEAWSDPASTLSQVALSQDDISLVLRTGYGKDDKEPFFILDFDCFTQGKLALENVIGRCDRFHEIIYDAFRWCVRDEKLTAFKPVDERN